MKTQPNRVAGVGGWLLFFLIVLIGRMYLFVQMDGYQVVRFFERSMNWPAWVIGSRALLYGLEALVPFWIIYVLVTRRAYAVTWTKAFILLAPLSAFISYFHDGPYSLFDFKFRLLLSLITFSVPWFLYFSTSKRVRNTYMFTEELLPTKIECPFCSATLELSRSERASRNVSCPECQGMISPGGATG